MLLKILCFVTSILFLSVEEIRALQINQTATCGSSEVCYLRLNQPPEQIFCDCGSSTNCSWSMFGNRGEILSSGVTEATLMWQNTGYGQYVCLSDNSTVERNIVILPEIQDESCEACISVRVCMMTTRTYLYFSMHFDQSLLRGGCELLLNRTVINPNITEQSCVELFSNLNYLIRCPICLRDINHVIPNNMFTNIPDCSSDSGICGISTQSSTASIVISTANSLSLVSNSTLAITEVLSTTATVMTHTITSPVKTTMTPVTSTVSGESNDNSDLGVVIGGVISGVVGLLIVVLIIAVVYFCIKTQPCNRNPLRGNIHGIGYTNRDERPDNAEVSNQLVDGHHRLMERTSDATPTDQPDDEHLVNQSSSLSENQLDDNQHPSDNGLEASQSILADASHQLSDGHHLLTDETPNTMSQPNQPPTDNQPPVNQSSSLLDNQLDANQHPSDNDLEASQSKVAGYIGEDHNKATRAERIFQLLNCDYKQLSNAITKLHPIIKKHINFETLVPFLNSRAIFTDDEMDVLINASYKAEKVNKLITSLPTKDKDGIYNFVKALNDAHEHSGHGEILDNLKRQLSS